ncbi:MazG nucleotide pyrophosphohydrolase domain-containing protein [Carboxylicivirga sp. N1Y90]|uniref:MazG nucleotide pyrophosphohydrolase domain-containing protein n=1 Tax=Carboxylicivirga fragile TaxID=3417571 RepID=UPI003D33A7BE|nr:hypothetical protein [Marinilabiliaceae bacterium N1Y90]
MKDLELREKPTLKDYQEYVNMLEVQRGFIDQDVIVKGLLLGEEIGELFKAIRKTNKIKTDINANVGSVKEELADILIYLCSIANRYDIDLEEAFREKEEINKKRVWK